MNPTPSSIGIARPIRRFHSLRRAAFVAAAIFTLIAVFYTVEFWRGHRAWENCQRDLKAKGEQLNWAAYVPARVPDELNFIKTPLLEAVGYRGRVNTNTWKPFQDSVRFLVWEAGGDAQAGRKIDWDRYQAELRDRTNLNLPPLPQAPAADLLHSLRPIEAQLDELRIASLKPQARFDIDRTSPFEESRDFNFVAVRILSQILAFHASAELTLDHSDKAFADTRVIHRFSEALKEENTLVAFMINVALQGLAVEPFWQGWAERRWSERELAGFQDLFGQVDLLPEFNRVVRAERAGAISYFEKHGIQQSDLGSIMMRDYPVRPGWRDAIRQFTQMVAWKLIPRGWVYQNLVSYSQRIQDFVLPSLQSKPPTIAPAQVKQIMERLSRESPHRAYGWMSEMAVPNFAKALEVLTRTQTTVNQASIVCALERCRMARGHYPESLAELTPQFIEKLPTDPINGRAMNYRRTDDGKFLLYSVGWNETDDGGNPGMTGGAFSRPDFTRGDWLWQFPK